MCDATQLSTMAYNNPSGSGGAGTNLDYEDFFIFYTAKHGQDLIILKDLESALLLKSLSPPSIMGGAYVNVALYEVQKSIRELEYELTLLEGREMNMVTDYQMSEAEIIELRAWKMGVMRNGVSKERLAALKTREALDMAQKEYNDLMGVRTAIGPAFDVGANGTVVSTNVEIPDGMEYLKYMFAYRIRTVEEEKRLFNDLVKAINEQFAGPVAKERYSFSQQTHKAMRITQHLAMNRLQSLNIELAKYRVEDASAVLDFDIVEWDGMIRLYQNGFLQPHNAERGATNKRRSDDEGDISEFGENFEEEAKKQQEEREFNQASRLKQVKSDANLLQNFFPSSFAASLPASQPMKSTDGQSEQLQHPQPTRFWNAGAMVVDESANGQQTDLPRSKSVPQSFVTGLPPFHPDENFFGFAQNQALPDSPPTTEPDSQA